MFSNVISGNWNRNSKWVTSQILIIWEREEIGEKNCRGTMNNFVTEHQIEYKAAVL